MTQQISSSSSKEAAGASASSSSSSSSAWKGKRVEHPSSVTPTSAHDYGQYFGRFFEESESSFSSTKKARAGSPPPPPSRNPKKNPPRLAFRINAQTIRPLISVGQLFLSYRIIEELGKGWEGPAYLLQDLQGNKKVLKLKNDDEKGDEAIASEIASQFQQYCQLRTYEFPVAINDRFEQLFLQKKEELNELFDHDDWKDFVKKHVQEGYYLVEYVPRRFPEPRDDIPENPEELSPWEQLKEFFKTCYEKGIAVDLQKDNVGLTEDGKLCYFDLHPLEEDTTEILLTPEQQRQYFARNPSQEELDEKPQKALSPLLRKHLSTFTKEGSALWEFLDPRN